MVNAIIVNQLLVGSDRRFVVFPNPQVAIPQSIVGLALRLLIQAMVSLTESPDQWLMEVEGFQGMDWLAIHVAAKCRNRKNGDLLAYGLDLLAHCLANLARPTA
jgi:hypothetical protein